MKGVLMFSIDVQGGKPIYEQLFDRITELIINGTMKEDERLPAVREVAKDMGINPNTVQKTYQMLEASGMIYSIPAKGSYVAKQESAIASIISRAKEQFSQSVEYARRQGLTNEEMFSIINNTGGKEE